MATNEIVIKITADDDASDVFDKVKNKLGGLGDAGGKARDKLGPKPGGLGGAMSGLAGIAGGPWGLAIGAAVGGLTAFGKSAVDAAAELERLKSQLIQSEGSAENAEKRMATLVQTSKDIIGLDLNNLIAFNVQLKAVGLTSAETDTTIQAVVKGMAQAGYTSAETAGVLTQLQQAFASNKLQAEDLKTVFRSLPAFTTAVKNTFGETVVGLDAFKEAAAAAGLTAREALLLTLEELDTIAKGASLETYSAQLELLKEDWQQFKQTAGEGLLPVLKSLFEPIRDLVNAFQEIGKAWNEVFGESSTQVLEMLDGVLGKVGLSVKDFFSPFGIGGKLIVDSLGKIPDMIRGIPDALREAALAWDGWVLGVQDALNQIPILEKAIDDYALFEKKVAHDVRVLKEEERKAAVTAAAEAAAEEKRLAEEAATAQKETAKKYRIEEVAAIKTFLGGYKTIEKAHYDARRDAVNAFYNARIESAKNSLLSEQEKEKAIENLTTQRKTKLDEILKDETAARVKALDSQLLKVQETNNALEKDETTTREQMKTAVTGYYELQRTRANLAITDANKKQKELLKIDEQEDKAIRAIDSAYDTKEKQRNAAAVTAARTLREQRTGEMGKFAAEAKLNLTKITNDERWGIDERIRENNRLYGFLKGEATARITDNDALQTKLYELEDQRIKAQEVLEKNFATEQKARRDAREAAEQAAKDAAIQATTAVKDARIQALADEEAELLAKLSGAKTAGETAKTETIQRSLDIKTEAIANLQAETEALTTELDAARTAGDTAKEEEIQRRIDVKTDAVKELQAETIALETELANQKTAGTTAKTETIQRAIDIKTESVKELQAETTALETELAAAKTAGNTAKTETIQRAIDIKTESVKELQAETTALETELANRKTAGTTAKTETIQRAIDIKTESVKELQAETTALETELAAAKTAGNTAKTETIQRAIDIKTESVKELQAETTALETELGKQETLGGEHETSEIQRRIDVKSAALTELAAETTALTTELGKAYTAGDTHKAAEIKRRLDVKNEAVKELQAETTELQTQLDAQETAADFSTTERIGYVHDLHDIKAQRISEEITDDNARRIALEQNEEDRADAVKTILDDEKTENERRLADAKTDIEDFHQDRIDTAQDALDDILANEQSSGRERRQAVKELFDAKADYIEDNYDDEKEKNRELKKLDKDRQEALDKTLTDMERAQRDYFDAIMDMALETFKYQIKLMVDQHKAEKQVERSKLQTKVEFETDWEGIVADYEARIQTVREQAAPRIAAEADKTKRNALIAERDEIIAGIVQERTDELQGITDAFNDANFDLNERLREIQHDAQQERNKNLWSVVGQVAGTGIGLGVSYLTGGAIPPDVAAKIGGDLGKFGAETLTDIHAEGVEDEFLRGQLERWQGYERQRAENERNRIFSTGDLDEALVGSSFDPAVIAQEQLDAQEEIAKRLQKLRDDAIDDLEWEVKDRKYLLDKMLEDEDTTVESLKAAHRELWDFIRPLRFMQAEDRGDLENLTDRKRLVLDLGRERIDERDALVEQFLSSLQDSDDDADTTPALPTRSTAASPAKDMSSGGAKGTKAQKDADADTLEDLRWEVEDAKHYLDEMADNADATYTELADLSETYWNARLAVARERYKDDTKRLDREETRLGRQRDTAEERLFARFDQTAATPETPAVSDTPTVDIGELRWDVESAQHALDELAKDTDATYEQLQAASDTYWNARLALAEATIDNTTELDREQTRISWRRTAAETRLFARFADDVKTTAADASTDIQATSETALGATADIAATTTDVVKNALGEEVAVTQTAGLNITHIIAAINAFKQAQTGASTDTLKTALGEEVNATKVAGLNITHIVAAINAFKQSQANATAGATETALGAEVNAAQSAGVSLMDISNIVQLAKQEWIQETATTANTALGTEVETTTTASGAMGETWKTFYATLKTDALAWWRYNFSQHGFAILVAQGATDSMRAAFENMYTDIMDSASGAYTWQVGLLDALSDKIADLESDLNDLQAREAAIRRVTPQTRRRIRTRELFHDPGNDTIAALGGAAVAADIARTQRENANDFTRYFGNTLMRGLSSVAPAQGSPAGPPQEIRIVMPIEVQFSDGTIEKQEQIREKLISEGRLVNT